jgi:cephalosporin-C deacetylase-like acetyl esterase
LLLPDDGKATHPVAITLQGHSTGFHNSVGILKYEGDEEYQETRGKFAVQAVKRGYATLALEQRAMGERKTKNAYGGGVVMCTHLAVKAMHLGRTLLGERVWDVSKAIDALSFFKDRGLDLDKIVLTGNSGGGTMSFYAAAFDERIKISAPSCAFCSYESSIMSIFHCPCNYLPGAMRYFEMGDLACAIAPRRLIVVAGQEDRIFPIAGVREAYVRQARPAQDPHIRCQQLVLGIWQYFARSRCP